MNGNNLSDAFKKNDSEIWKHYLFDSENDPTSQYFYARLWKKYKLNSSNNKCSLKIAVKNVKRKKVNVNVIKKNNIIIYIILFDYVC